MDALDILTNLDHVVPFFQPIFSADEHRIIGYEILGRFKMNDKLESLGPFFHDESVPDEYRLEVDNTVLKKALDHAITLDQDVLLFINRNTDLLLHDDGENLLQLLQQYAERGISLERIVIEIAEGSSNGNLQHLDHLLNYYRTYGIKIAIDKMGHDSSHLDRIGQLSPNIIKVDLSALRSTNAAPAYQDILYSISMLARKIGASLLFENIEMVYQLQFAWKNGGRYYQGYYLQEPGEQFSDRDILKEKLREKFHQFIVHEKKKLEALYSISEKFQIKVQDILVRNKKMYHAYTELLNAFVTELNHIAFRMYICDEDGFQKSPNILKKGEEWVLQKEYINKNWSWRPYFLENIFKMRNEKKGILSDLYCDIENGETIRTFSFPLNSNEYIFIDLTYEFLYQHEGLL